MEFENGLNLFSEYTDTSRLLAQNKEILDKYKDVFNVKIQDLSSQIFKFFPKIASIQISVKTNKDPLQDYIIFNLCVGKKLRTGEPYKTMLFAVKAAELREMQTAKYYQENLDFILSKKDEEVREEMYLDELLSRPYRINLLAVGAVRSHKFKPWPANKSLVKNQVQTIYWKTINENVKELKQERKEDIQDEIKDCQKEQTELTKKLEQLSKNIQEKSALLKDENDLSILVE